MISWQVESPFRPHKFLLGILFTLLMATTSGCGGGGSSESTDSSSTSSTSTSSSGNTSSSSGSSGSSAVLRLPPENGGLDYQLGEPYALPPGVTIVSRDKSAPVAAGAYNICYINGFQTQPDEAGFWTGSYPELLLRDQNGQPIEDQDWPGEYLLDITTPEKRAALAAIERSWIEGCSAAGYDAVEVDNLDTYSRSGGRIAEADAVAFIRSLADIAHGLGLAIAQKNSAEIASRRMEMGTDFVVSEECNRWNECGTYIDVYGSHVLMIEYRQQDFDKACASYPAYSVVLRNVMLTAPGSSNYIFAGC